MIGNPTEPPTPGNGPFDSKTQLIELLRYIEQIQRHDSAPALTVPEDLCCLYEAELRGLAGASLNQVREGDEVWLRLKRPDPGRPPAPPEALKPWIEQSDAAESEPRLHARINGPRDGEIQNLEDHPEIEQLHRSHLEETWRPWAADLWRRRKPYDDLYRFHQSTERAGDESNVELIFGLGVVVWRLADGRLVRHPLITWQVGVSLDLSTQAIEIRPWGRPPQLETTSFAALGVPGVAALEDEWRTRQDQADAPLSPFDGATFERVLKAAAALLDARGTYAPGAGGLPAPGQQLVVTDTWVLFARHRPPEVLIGDLRRLQESLERVAEVPAGPAALVSELPDQVSTQARVHFRGLSHRASAIPKSAETRDLYFPKPYNEEQLSIIERLEVSPGVVVQGPPGTGKTHTIANVICHYLAMGRRVLVTSKGEPALAVLRDQIPKSVRPLIVAILTDEAAGMQQFEQAIELISGRLSLPRPGELEARIVSLERRADELHASLSEIDAEIAQWAARHLKPLHFDGAPFLPEALARLMVKDAAAHAWFPDTEGLCEPGLPDADMDVLRNARRDLGANLTYVVDDLPPEDDLPDAQTVARHHSDLVRVREIEKRAAQDASALSLLNASAPVLEDAVELGRAVSEALEIHEHFHATGLSAMEGFQRICREGEVLSLQALEHVLREGESLDQQWQTFVARPVEIPKDADRVRKFRRAIERCSMGRAPFRLPLFAGAPKEQLAQILVAAEPPQTQEDWAHAWAYIELCGRLRGLIGRWNAVAPQLHLRELDPSMGDLASVTACIGDVKAVRGLVGLDARIDRLAPRVFLSPPSGRHLALDRASLERMSEALRDPLAVAGLRESARTVAGWRQCFERGSGELMRRMREFLHHDLGAGHLSSTEISTRWTALRVELQALYRLKPLFDEVRRCCRCLQEAGAIRWAQALRTVPVDGDIDPLMPATWRRSWGWHQAAALLRSIDGRLRLRELQARRTMCESDLARTYEHLVETKTWREVIRRATPAVKGALQAYLAAVERRGGGARAARHRRDARAAMEKAVAAVPCWIMPQWRVSESLPPQIGSFDLVIVDEASQSDVSVLPCLLRGAKILVVGDGRQVSPEAIGVSEARIRELSERFLRGQVHGSQMTPERSLYDLARVAFAGEMVMLREHFRSVASIIEFSNREFYYSQIIPLRVPAESERFDRPLVDVRVHGARRSGRDRRINEAEAAEIVKEIKSTLTDPRFKGRSMGVVSLLGMEQADRISELIHQHIPVEEIQARRIMVGDARTFQGNERDIMFLSMVATREHHTAATAQMFEQRFNVAASRARDRMYLFRSIDYGDVLPVDLKARLISHFRAPFRHGQMQVGPLRALCESELERDLFDELTRAGYRVQPMVPVGTHHIDLVVQGREDRRLAVACDGDKLEEEDQWSREMERQRVLERAGWTFWRCFGASFYWSRQEVLADLFDTLRVLKIEPIGAGDAEFLRKHTEHRDEYPPNPEPGTGDDGTAKASEREPAGMEEAAAPPAGTVDPGVTAAAPQAARCPRICAVAENGDVMELAEGSPPWKQKAESLAPRIFSICLAHNGRHGCVAGAAGAVIRTADWGETWTRVRGHGAHQTLRSVHFAADASHGWAVGAVGAVIVTDNGGETWARRNMDGQEGLTCVCFAADSLHGWAAGANGVVIATDDGGVSWDRQTTKKNRGLVAIHFRPDGLHGWAVGKSGAAIGTTDGGVTWVEQASGMTVALHAVYFINESTGWAVGAKGSVIVTTDGGMSWNPGRSGIGVTLNAIRFAADGRLGWAVAVDGTVLSSDDGGWTWTVQSGPAGFNLRCACFANEG